MGLKNLVWDKKQLVFFCQSKYIHLG